MRLYCCYFCFPILSHWLCGWRYMKIVVLNGNDNLHLPSWELRYPGSPTKALLEDNVCFSSGGYVSFLQGTFS